MMNRRQFTPAHSKSRQIRIVIIVVVLVIVFAIPSVRNILRNSVSVSGTLIARGNNAVGGFFASISTSFKTKYSLESENTNLKNQIQEINARLLDRNEIANENAGLKAIMGRNNSYHFLLASIIAKPPVSMYDSLLIDGGKSIGLFEGQTVFANGETPIGTIEQVFSNSAIVRLYSSPGQKTDARLNISNVDVLLTGTGGGNFSVTVPHDLNITDGMFVVTKNINPNIIARYVKVTSDPRDPFQTLIFVAPVNINELSFVEIAQ